MFRNLSTTALGISGTPNELIEMALSYGFKSVDLDVVDFARQVQLRGLPHSRRLLDSAKLRLGSFPLPIAWDVDDAAFKLELEKLPPLAELARELNCLRTTLTIAPASDERPYHQNFEFHRRRLAEVGAALEPFGISLGVGFLAPDHHRQGKSFEFLHGLEALGMLLTMLGRKNVGLALDVWHLHVSGGDLEAIRKLTAGQIVTVTLADAPAEMTAEDAREESRLLPGETGTIDAPAILSLLAEMEYDGPVTVAPDPSQLTGLRRDELAKRVGQSLEAAWKAAGLDADGKLSPQAQS